jgi:DNA-binding MarR family transcriptional regulator
MSDELLARYLSEPDSAGLFTRLTRVALRLEAFQRRCLDGLDLNFGDFAVLRVLILAEPDHELLPTELSELLLRSSGGITQIVDRLEARGLLRRRRDTTDGRRVLVGLTPEGHRLGELASDRYRAGRAALLEPLEAAEVAEIDRSVTRLLALLDADPGRTAGLRAEE